MTVAAIPSRFTPAVRTNLSRFGVFLDMPEAIAALIIDLIDVLPDADIKQLLQQLARKEACKDLSHIPAQFLHWLLLDSTHGAINLSRRDDVRDAVTLVCQEALEPVMRGNLPEPIRHKHALFTAQIAQFKTWHAYEFRRDIDGLQPRIEWMVATAALDALLPHRPEQLVGIVHSCAVAWSARAQSKLDGLSFYELHFAIRDKLVDLLGLPAVSSPATASRIDKGARVQFDDLESGTQRGTVLGLIDSAPPSAVVLVDHSLSGITWNVPLHKLKLIDAHDELAAQSIA